MPRDPEPETFGVEVVDGRPCVRAACDLSTAAALEGLTASESQPLEVDFSGVTFFDSSALRALLNVQRRNPTMRILNPSNAVLKVLEITGTSEHLVDRRDGA